MDSYNLVERLDFLRLGPRDVALIRRMREPMRRNLPRILSDFYGHIMQFEVPRQRLGQPDVLARARKAQEEHWLEFIFAGRFDAAYFDRVTRIGKAHVRIGLTPQWYVGAYVITLNHVIRVVNKACWYRPWAKTATMQAVQKALFLDMDLAISVYQDVRDAKARALAERVEAFETELPPFLAFFATAATQFQSTASVLQSSSARASEDSRRAADTSQLASEHLQRVAAASEEMTASIHGISHEVQQSARLSQNGQTLAEETVALFQRLEQNAQSIGRVLNLIQEIAGQTNLLALNATIEAARAGEAGRGFSVVAGEVKELARQTSRATDDVNRQIQEVQDSTTKALDAMTKLGQAIREINGINRVVQDGMRDQSQVVSDLAQNLAKVSSSSLAVSDSIGEVAAQVSTMDQGSADMLKSATRLATQSGELNTLIQSFVADIKLL